MRWEKTTMGERLEALRRHHGVSMRELSEGAGRSPTHAEQLINQGQKGMNAKSALGYARKWNVPVDWLTEGKGDPFSDVAPTQTRHEDPRYPNLEEALELMRSKILEETYERQRSIAMHFPTDLSVGEWVDQIKVLDASVRKGAEGRQLEEEDDVPPAGR